MTGALAGRATGAALGGLLVLVVISAAVLAMLDQLNPFSANPAIAGDAATGGAPVAVADIPSDYLALYVAATRTCPGLDWSVLAAIGKIETDHGRSTLPGVHGGANAAGSVGIMQFQPSTWASVIARHPIPAGGSTPPSPYSPHDAIYAAASYVCDSGGGNPATLNRAIFSYNHSNQYVADVLAQAQKYRTSATLAPATPGQGVGGDATEAWSGGSNGAPSNSASAVAISWVRAQIGRPYVWGGNGETGFDCSGLTKAAYAAAGITLPRTADQQFRAGPRLPANESLQPGDLVFYGSPTITHVALFVGGNQVVEAKDVGTLIAQDPLPTSNYSGATRPAGNPSAHPNGSNFFAAFHPHSDYSLHSDHQLSAQLFLGFVSFVLCYCSVHSSLSPRPNGVWIPPEAACQRVTRSANSNSGGERWHHALSQASPRHIWVRHFLDGRGGIAVRRAWFKIHFGLTARALWDASTRAQPWSPLSGRRSRRDGEAAPRNRPLSALSCVNCATDGGQSAHRPHVVTFAVWPCHARPNRHLRGRPSANPWGAHEAGACRAMSAFRPRSTRSFRCRRVSRYQDPRPGPGRVSTSNPQLCKRRLPRSSRFSVTRGNSSSRNRPAPR
jgi:cell wall-associated NlpC family hydrolase